MRIDIQTVVNGAAQKVGKNTPKNKAMNLFDNLYINKGEPQKGSLPVKKTFLISKEAAENVLAVVKEKFRNKEVNPKEALKAETVLAREHISSKEKIGYSKTDKLLSLNESIIHTQRVLPKTSPIVNGLTTKETVEKGHTEVAENGKKELKLPINDSSFHLKSERSTMPFREMDMTEPQNLIKKEEKLELMSNKIKANPDINISLKEKLLQKIEVRKESHNVIEDLKKEIHRAEIKENVMEIRENKELLRFEHKLEIKEWVSKIKSEIRNMVDFKVESENKIKFFINDGNDYIRIHIEKINNEIVIQSDTSDSMKKRMDEILTEVKIEMKEKNIEVRLDNNREGREETNEEDRERESRKQEHPSNKGKEGEKDRSDDANQ